MKWICIVWLVTLTAFGQNAPPDLNVIQQKLSEAEETIRRLRKGSDADIETFKREAAVREKAIGRKLIKEVNDRLAAEKKMRESEKRVADLMAKQEEAEIQHREALMQANSRIDVLTNQLADVRKSMVAPPTGTETNVMLSALQQQVMELMEEVSGLERERDANNKKIIQLTNAAEKNRQLALDLQALRNSMEQADKQMLAQSQLLDNLQEKNANLSQVNETLTESSKNLSKENQELIAKNQELAQMRIASESEVVKQLRQSQDALEKSNRSLEEKFASQIGQVQRLKAELSLRNQQLAKLETMKSNPDATTLDALAKLENEVKMRDDAITALGQKAAMGERLEKVNTQLETDIKTLDGKLKVEVAKRDEMTTELTTLAKDIAKVQADLLEEQQKSKSMEEKRTALQALASRQANDLDRVQKDALDQEAKAVALEEKGEKLSADLAMATEKADALTRELAEARKGMTAAASSKEVEELRKRMADLEKRAEERAKDLDKQVAELKNKLAGKDKRIQDLQKSADEAKALADANTRLTDELALMKQAMADSAPGELVKKFEAASKKLEQNDVELKSLGEQIATLKRERSASQQETLLATKALDAMTRKLEATESDLNSSNKILTAKILRLRPLMKDVASLSNDLVQAQATLASAQQDAAKVPALQQKLASLEKTVGMSSVALATEVDALKRELEATQEALATTKNEVKTEHSLDQANQLLKDQVAALTKAMEAKPGDIRPLLKELAQLGGKMADVQAELTKETKQRKKDQQALAAAELERDRARRLATRARQESEKLRQENRDFEMQRDAVANELLILSNNHTRAIADLQLARQDLQRAQADQAVQTVRAEKLQQANIGLTQRLKVADDSLEAAQLDIEELGRQAESLAKEFLAVDQAYSNQVKSFEQTMDILSSVSNKLSETSRSLSQTTNSLKEKEASLAKREKELDLTTKELDTTRKNAMQMQANLEKEIASQELAVQQLTTNLLRRTEELAESRLTVKELTLEGEKLLAKLEAETMKLDTETKRADIAEAARDTLKKQRADLEKTKDRLSRSLAQTKKKLDDTEMRRKDLASNLDRIKKENEQLTLANRSINATNFILQAGLERSSRAITRISEELAETGMELDQMTADRDRLAKRETQLVSLNENLELRLTQSLAQGQTISNNLENSQQDLAKMSAELETQLEARDVLADQLVQTADTLRDTRNASVQQDIKASDKLKDEQSKRRVLADTIKAKNKDIAEREKDIAEKLKSIEQLQASETKLLADLKKGQKQLATATAGIKDRDGKIEERDGRLTAMTKELSDLSLKLGTASMELSRIGEAYAKSQKDLKQSGEKNAKLAATINKLGQDLAQKTEQATTLSNQYTTLKKDIAAVQVKLKAESELAMQRATTIKDRDAKIKSMQGELTKQGRQIDALVDGSDRQRKIIDTLESENKNYGLEVAKLTTQLGDTSDELDVTNQKLADKNAEVMTLTEQRTSITKTVNSYKTDLTKLTKEKKALNADILALSQKMQMGEGQIAFLQTATSSVVRLEKRLEESQRDASLIRGENKRLNASVLQLTASEEMLRRQIDAESRKIVARDADIAKLQKEISAITRKSVALQSEIAMQTAKLTEASEREMNLRNDLNQTREKLSSAEFKMTQLVSEQQKLIARMKGLLSVGTVTN